MFKQKKFYPKKKFNTLFLSKSNIIKMKKLGHIIGLHSDTHPTNLKHLSYDNQLKQYNNNIKIISNILIKAMYLSLFTFFCEIDLILLIVNSLDLK